MPPLFSGGWCCHWTTVTMDCDPCKLQDPSPLFVDKSRTWCSCNWDLNTTFRHSDVQVLGFPKSKKESGRNKAANFRESSNATKKQCQLLSLKRLHPRQQSHQLRPPKTKHLHGVVPIESNWLHKIGYIPWLWNLKSWVLHKFPSP